MLHQSSLFDSALSNDWDCSEYKCLGEHLDESQALPASVIFLPLAHKLPVKLPTIPPSFASFLFFRGREMRGLMSLWTWWRWTSWGCWGTAGCLELSSGAMLAGTGVLNWKVIFLSYSSSPYLTKNIPQYQVQLKWISNFSSFYFLMW